MVSEKEKDPVEKMKTAAASADAAAKNNATKRGPGRPAGGPAKAPAADPQVLIPQPDPFIQDFAFNVFDALVQIVHEKRDWVDPGKKWKENLAACVARLAAKYQTSLEYADEVMLAGLLLVWLVPNLMAEVEKRKEKKETLTDAPSSKPN